ncbi:MAG: pyruvate ferredoxin oxidoreductase subunit gamma [Candidatus Hodarchaeaceae archaeon]|nr:pyruvate ferredoxin oxidoreductase subunit gamma [Candidatus Hodarchaeaceae archaeon]
MIEVRFHGRAGQGAVTAARLLAEAAFLEGKCGQAFPFFGAERRGAPVVAFARIDNKPIRIRTQVYEPNHVVVLDPTLLEVINVAAGLRRGGTLVLNAKKTPEGISGIKVAVIDATGVAIETLGVPITNTAILGALAKATKLVSLNSIIKAVRNYFGDKLAEKNVAAVKAAYERTQLMKLS